MLLERGGASSRGEVHPRMHESGSLADAVCVFQVFQFLPLREAQVHTTVVYWVLRGLGFGYGAPNSFASPISFAQANQLVLRANFDW